MSEDSYQPAYQRERKARQLAEQLLEEKSRALYDKVLELESTVEQLKTTQSQLLHAEKMASIGQLVAGIAHELNTPLGFCRSNLETLQFYSKKLGQLDQMVLKALSSGELDAQHYELCRKELQLDYTLSDCGELLNDTLYGIDRIGSIVAGLRMFSEEQNNSRQLVNLSQLTEQAITLSCAAIHSHIVVLPQLQDALFIKGCPTELLQLMLNILTNAIQACGESGQIRVRVWSENQQVKLLINNDGPCIAPEHLLKIFDPFFTTKEVGQGTGLGLSIVAGIMKRHQGDVAVTSSVKSGTEFICSFPASNEPQGT